MKDKLDIMKMRNAPPAEIEARILEFKKQLMDRRFALKVGSQKDTAELSRLRKAIATLKGFITNKKAPKAAVPTPEKKKK